MASYTINEPHPTVAQNSYTHSGRGGAGNTFRVSTAITSPAGIPTNASASSKSSSSPGRFYSGRGGAGNAHSAAERAALSFDEEYAEAARHATAPIGHVGRGGAGNVFGAGVAATPSATARRDSSSTSGSERSGFWGRMSSGSRH